MFPTTTYVSRRNRLIESLDSGLVLLLGNDESPMNYADNTYPFRQDSTFLYYFGLDQPGLAAVIDVDEGESVIFGNELSIDDIVWMGDLPTVADRAAQVGVSTTRPYGDLEQFVHTARSQGRAVHVLPPYRAENVFQLMQLLQVPYDEARAAGSLELVQTVVAMRSVKDEDEIREIGRAVDTSVDMHLAAMRIARPEIKEFEIAAEVERVARAAGGRLSYPVIATVHGETLHNHNYHNTLSSGDLLLLDTGAETELHYAGDLSSTFPVDSTFTARQREVYEISLEAYEAAIAKLGPGVPNLEVHLTAARVIAAGMKSLGLMKGNVDDAVAAGAHAMFFPCGVGHMMGLDVHDMEDLGEVWVGYDGQPKSAAFGLKSLRLARPLQPGFVLTVEPGIYFIPQLMDLWRGQGRFTEFIDYDRLDEWRSFGGIRNEENFLITETSARRLGKAKPKTVAEVEAIRGGR